MNRSRPVILAVVLTFSGITAIAQQPSPASVANVETAQGQAAASAPSCWSWQNGEAFTLLSLVLAG